MDERERVLLTLAGVRVFIGVFWLVNLLWRLPTDFGEGNFWGLPHILDVARAATASRRPCGAWWSTCSRRT